MYEHRKSIFLWNIFHEKSSQYDLRPKNLLIYIFLFTSNYYTLHEKNKLQKHYHREHALIYGNHILIFRGSILWNYLQNDIKSKTSVCSFKKCIKSGSGEDCSCKIWK